MPQDELNQTPNTMVEKGAAKKRVVKRKVKKRRSLQTRVKQKLNKLTLCKTKLAYIIMGIIISAIAAYFLIGYLSKDEPVSNALLPAHPLVSLSAFLQVTQHTPSTQ